MTTLNDVLNSQHHIMVNGETGSGKTTVGEYLHEYGAGYSIFVNIQHEPVVGREVARWGRREMAESKKINFNPEISDAQYIRAVERITFELMEMGKQHCEEYPRSHWVTLIVDEAPVFLPQGADNYLLQALRRGKRYGVRIILIAQNPVDVSKTARTQCHNHIIFELNAYNRPYFKTHGMDYDEIKKLTMEKYFFTVWDGKTYSKRAKLKL